jgi:hypothetical protein
MLPKKKKKRGQFQKKKAWNGFARRARILETLKNPGLWCCKLSDWLMQQQSAGATQWGIMVNSAVIAGLALQKKKTRTAAEDRDLKTEPAELCGQYFCGRVLSEMEPSDVKKAIRGSVGHLYKKS